MLGKIIGAIAGSRLAKASKGGMDGATGAIVGVAGSTLVKRLSIPAILVLGAGGYAVKKMSERRSRKSV